MSRLFDFNLSTPRNKSEQSTTSECAVVVNNTINQQPIRPRNRPLSRDLTVRYPEAEEPFPETPIIVDDAKSDPQLDVLTKQLNIYKTMCKCFVDILKTTNAKLLVNLIDQSSKIIIDGTSLVEMISLLTEVPREQITLRCKSAEPGCFAKVCQISYIEDIKVANLDFRLQYNEKYNILTEELGISLVKVFKV
jgi:hypothetical protein